MSKQLIYSQANKIYESIIKNNNEKLSLSEHINKICKNKEDEIEIANEVSKILSKNGYLIISINPLKIKHQ